MQLKCYFTMKSFLLFIFCLTIAYATIQLPNDFTTLFYTLSANVEYSNSTFIGQSIIYASPMVETNSITIHAAENLHNLRVNYIFEDGSNTNYWEVQEVLYDNETEFLKIILTRNIPVGITIKIALDFEANLQEAGEYGLIKSSYIDEDGTLVSFVYTQFNPIFARRVFPCFDEPNKRAVFQIGIIRNEDELVISNGKVMGSLPHWEGSLDVVRPTLYMPSNFFGFAIGKFNFSESQNGKFRIYGRPAAIEQDLGAFALNKVEEMLNAMVNYPTYPYLMEKLYLLALPDESIENAISNWGFIVFKENDLFCAEDDPVEDRVRVIRTLANAVAQQFFGNLISASWWNNIWFTTGFAKFFEIYLSDFVEPDLNLNNELTMEILQKALMLDASLNVKPMSAIMESNEDILNAFNSYVNSEKAASIFRMLQHVVTDSVFKQFISNIFQTNAFYSLNEEMLWNILENTEGVLNNFPLNFISETMKTWTQQAGYPLVTVHKNDDGSILLKQERFYENITERSEEIWNIPVSYTLSRENNFDTQPKFWLTKEQDILPGIVLGNDESIVINLQQTGFYRVNYDESMWKKIFSLKTDPTTELQLKKDALMMCKTGRLHQNICLTYL